MSDDLLESIRARIDQPTARGVATTIGALVSDGTIAPGDRLPTVRSLAGTLGVSSSTIADAWRILADHGVITTDRRRGTTVRTARADLSGRYWQVPVEPGTIDLDLSTGTPDAELLPPLGPVLRRIHADVGVTSYVDRPILPELEAHLLDRWPFAPEALTVVDGALDALDRIVGAIVRFGDTVVIENPTFPPLIDLVEQAGARVIGVGLNADGPDPHQLADALAQDPVAVFVQPRAQNPTGATLTARSAARLAELIEPSRALVVEDDHSGAAAGVALASIGQLLPDRTIHVHSFSKSHGPDLRIAAVGGPEAPIDAIVRRRQLGPSWTSRLLQQILVALLEDPGTDELIDHAATQYQLRRTELTAALADHGIEVVTGHGLNMWVPVSDEQRAVVALAAQSTGVAPGRPFCVGESAADHIRVSLGEARGDFETIAARIANAAPARRSA